MLAQSLPPHSVCLARAQDPTKYRPIKRVELEEEDQEDGDSDHARSKKRKGTGASATSASSKKSKMQASGVAGRKFCLSGRFNKLKADVRLLIQKALFSL